MTEETPTTVDTPSREERIGKLAYQIWEEEGRPEGQHEDHWFRATALIDAEDQAADAPLPAYLKKEDGVEGPEAAKPVIAGKTDEKPSLEELTRRMRSRTAA